MNGNELDTFGGGPIGPYHNTEQPLVPAPADDWGVTPDYPTLHEIADYQGQPPGGQVHLFGETMPGATQQHVEQALNEIAAVVSGDLVRLGHPQSWIDAALTWFKESARKTPQREPKRHSFNLWDQAGDLVAESFGNAIHRAGGSQEFVNSCLWLMDELSKKLGESQGKPATDGTPDISDADYDALVARSEHDRQVGLGQLKSAWGNSYDQNLQTVARYFEGLSQQEQAHFDTFVTGGVHALNDPTIIMALYKHAIGGHAMPTGSSLQSEIDEIERFIKTNRKDYNNDLRLQARLRELYTLRDG